MQSKATISMRVPIATVVAIRAAAAQEGVTMSDWLLARIDLSDIPDHEVGP